MLATTPIIPPAWLRAWCTASAVFFLASVDAVEPRVMPDELCHIGWARALSGTAGFFSMGGAGYCEPGYAMLLAPLFALFESQESAYRAAIALNAVLAGACLPLAHRLGARHLGMSPSRAWVAAIIATAYTGLLYYSRHALPEALLYALSLLWLCIYCQAIDTRSRRAVILLALTTCALYLAHSRMLVVLLAFAACTLGWMIHTRDHSQRRLSLYLLAAIALLLYATHLAKGFAIAHGWHADPLIALDRVASLATPSRIAAALAKTSGQILFVAFATAGLALLPIAWTAYLASSLPRQGPAQFHGANLKLIAAPILLLLLALEGAVFLARSDRFDTFMYGRYVGPLIGPCMIVGLSLVSKSRARILLLSSLAVMTTCLGFMVLASPTYPIPDYSMFHVIGAKAGVDWLAQSSSVAGFWIKLASLSAATVVLLWMLLWRPWQWLAGAAVTVVMAMQITTPHVAGPSMSSHFPPALMEELSQQECSIYWSRSLRERLQLHHRYRLQYLRPHCRVVDLPADSCHVETSGVLVAPSDHTCFPGREGIQFSPRMRAMVITPDPTPQPQPQPQPD